MAYRITGLQELGLGVDWTKVPGDEDVARRVLAFLEDRRLLFGDRHYEDQHYCVLSAIEIRQYLTQELGSTKPNGGLATSLRAIRAACRQFIEAAGPNGTNFAVNRYYMAVDPFSLALGDLRTLVGVHVALVASQFDIPIEDDLATIMPPLIFNEEEADDASWIPGFQAPSGPAQLSIGEPIHEGYEPYQSAPAVSPD